MEKERSPMQATYCIWESEKYKNKMLLHQTKCVTGK